MTTSTLPLSLQISARVCLRSRSVLPLATGGTGAGVDAFVATFGFAELSVNAVARAWPSDVGKLAFSFSRSSSLSESSNTTISFASFFFVSFFFLSLGLVFVRPGPYQCSRKHSAARASACSSQNCFLRVFFPCLRIDDRACGALLDRPI
ncbi:hypothetical protein V8E53_005826, partial [Lactarius tabidus]